MNPILKIVTGLLGSSDFFDLFKGKEKQKNELILKLSEEIHKSNSKQIEINKIEANSQFSYVASWRPTIGYICALALFYQFFLREIINYTILIFDKNFPIPPTLDVTQIMSILLAMLGMAGYRTIEKIKTK
jgi:hypothetical protein|tara:strand:- start:268 stop:660 length:393 start_codon:yes stop_codon:yes gene_type:complete